MTCFCLRLILVYGRSCTDACQSALNGTRLSADVIYPLPWGSGKCGAIASAGYQAATPQLSVLSASQVFEMQVVAVYIEVVVEWGGRSGDRPYIP